MDERELGNARKLVEEYEKSRAPGGGPQGYGGT